ncbi:ATP synthase F0 subcomplex B subunit [Halogranum amylolyticum]|uniref:ATP synthase F0 subcomplex B subunit n=1 Tax=Halogranum amylolyticum TaxID=660520 RepID=A0A1H8UZL1_9EURY|nr:F0F1 ATP synthase subunit B [Halogranum amylolyticum]SEP08581.1 ATP synthase F0 subcomplex B subunit [Halogranum amylolyticum]
MAEIGIGVDWLTILFQSLNFLILLVILQRFLYRPLRKKMREREAEIESEITEAKQRAEEAEREREELEEKLEEAQEEAEKIRRDAREEAAKRREETLEQARADAADIRQEANERIQREEQAARERIQKRARQTAVELAEDLLRETGGEALHDQLVDRFLSGQDNLGDADRDRLADAIRKADGAVRIRTAYPLEERTQQRLRETLQDRLPWDDESSVPELEFSVEEDPELVAGLTLISGGVALDLNVKHTLEALTGGTTDEERADGHERRGPSRGEQEDEEQERAQKPQENGGETS